MKAILALSVILAVASAQNVIYDAPHGGHLGYHHGGPHYGFYFGNHLASGALPGYAVYPGYFGHHGLVAVAEKAEEDDAAVEEASRKKRDLLAVAPYSAHHFGYAGHHLGYAHPFTYSHAFASPYAHSIAYSPYSHFGYNQIHHSAPFYKVAKAEDDAEDDEAVEEASRKKRDITYAHHGFAHPGYLGFRAYAHPATYTTYAAVPVETEYTYKTAHYEDEDKPTPADTTLVGLVEKEHTAKAVHYEPRAFVHHAVPHLLHKIVAAKEESRKKRAIVYAHHGLGHLGYAHHGIGYLGYAHHGLAHHTYAAAVPVETEIKYKTAHYEDSDAPTPADTTLVDLVEKEHTAKSIHYEPRLFHH